MADRKISELTVLEASGISSEDLFLVVDVNEPDINSRSKRFTASGLSYYVFTRLSDPDSSDRFYVDEINSTQRGFFGVLGINTISGNTTSSGSVVNFASGVRVTIENFQNQNWIAQSVNAPTDSGTILWYRPPISGLLGRAYFRYVNPTGVGPSAVEWVEASPFEEATIEIGTQQVVSGIFNPLQIPAATNAVSGYGGIRYTDEDGKFLNASGSYTYIPITTSGIPGGVPTISGVQEGFPLVKQGNTVIYAAISGSVLNADFSGQQIRAGMGTVSAPSYTFTGDLNTGLYSPAADQLGITISGTQKARFENNLITFSGNINLNAGTLNTERDIIVNSVDIGLGGSNVLSNLRFGDQALGGNTTGQFNIGIGYQSLGTNQTGSNSTAVGYQSLFNSTAGNNSAYGAYALTTLTNGQYNSAFGQGSIQLASTAQYTAAFGYNSLYSTTNSFNTAIGAEAGYSNNTGQYNVLAGYRAGYNLTTGSNNTIIGNVTGTAGQSDTIIIAAGSAEKLKVDASNNVFLNGTIKTISGGTGPVPIYTTSGDPDTGLFFPAANTIGLSASGLGQLAIDINRVTVSGTLLANTISGTTITSTLGTAAVPSFSFSGDLNTGIYSPAADRVAIAASGLAKLAIDINRTTVSGTFYADTVSGAVITAGLGTASAPGFSFSGDLNTGLFSPSTDVAAITASGLTKLAIDINRVTASGTFYADTVSGSVVTAGLGTAAAPGFSFSGDLNTGIFSPSADRLAFVSSGLNIAEIRSSGVFISGLIYEAPTGTNYFPVVTQQDVGTEPNQVPLNQYLGNLAFLDNYYPTYNNSYNVIFSREDTASGEAPVGSVFWEASDGTGFIPAASIAVSIDGTPGTNDMPSRMVFSTTADAASGVTERLRLDNANNAVFSSFIRTVSGTRALPGVTPNGDTDTGFYFPAVDTIGISASGIGVLAVDLNRVTVSGTLLANTISGTTITSTLGTAATPSFSFSGDLNTGIFSPSADRLAFVSSGLNIAEIRSSGVFISGLIYEAPTGTNYFPVVTQQDIGTEPNQVPVNGFLGSMAYQEAEFITAGSGVFDFISSNLGVATVSGNIKVGNTTSRVGTDGTNQVVLFDGVAPSGTLVSGVSIYSFSGQLRSEDSAGSEVTLCPFISTPLGTPSGTILRANGSNGQAGIYFPNTNGIAFSTSGTERMRLTGTGRLLVGNNQTIVDAFGTTRIINAIGESANIGTHRNVADTFGNAFIFTKARGVNYETVVNEDILGRVSWQGANGSAYNIAAEILGAVDDVVSGGGASDMPGCLIFNTTPDGSATTVERMRITNAGNVKIGGTAKRATTEGTNQLVIYDGTAPVGTLANGCSFYSTAGEMRVMDSSGASTLLSPHDDNGYWVFDSTDTRTNRRLLVHMEKMAKWIDENFGTNFVEEIGGPPIPN